MTTREQLFYERDEDDDDASTDEERRAILIRNCKRRVARTFPSRAVDVALAADVKAPAIARICEWRGREDILVLAGGVGVGKTVAATWWAMQQTHAAVYVRAGDYLATPMFGETPRRQWLRASRLVLDDLGSERGDARGGFVADVEQLVDAFYADRRILLITTNCTADTFRQRYGERVWDRLRECGLWLVVGAASRRGKDRA